MKRNPPQPGEIPYYFNWTAVYADGRRVPQYDERGYLTLWTNLEKEGIVSLELYPHPMWVSGAPPIIVNVADTPESVRMVYEGRQPAETPDVRYPKHRMSVLMSTTEIVLTPDDWETAGREPLSGYSIEINGVA